jgi:hypothetical protein
MNEENKDLPESIKDTGAICERLWNSVTELLTSSLRLEDALVHRRKDEIWEILAEQENKASLLNQAATLWNQIYVDNEQELSPEIAQARESIKAGLQKLQIVEKVNYSLTRNYLAAVEKSMQKAGAGLAGKKKVYNKGGRLGLRASSMIFKSIG